MVASAEGNANLIQASRLRLNKINEQKRYRIQDARFATFNSLELVAVHSYMMLKLVAAFYNGKIDESTAKSYFGLNVRAAGAVDVIEHIEIHEKLFFTVAVNFNVELLVKILLQELRQSGVTDGFYKVAQELLTELAITNSSSKLLILNTIARIRNALHSGGIHTKDDVPQYTIKGQTFEFRKGSQVDCASWAHLCTAFDAIIDILDEIVKSSRVSDIARVLPWQFVPISRSTDD
jgi:hypothetical protein